MCASTDSRAIQDFLKKLVFRFFLQVDGTAKCTSESAGGTSRSSSTWSSPMIWTCWERGWCSQPPLRRRGSRILKLNEASLWQGRDQTIPLCTTISRGVKKATTLSEQWVKDRDISLPEVKYLPSLVDQKDAMYWVYQNRKGHIRATGSTSEIF